MADRKVERRGGKGETLKLSQSAANYQQSCLLDPRGSTGNCAAVKRCATLAHDKCNKLLPPQTHTEPTKATRLRKLIKRRRLDIFITTRQKGKSWQQQRKEGRQLREEFVNCHFSSHKLGLRDLPVERTSIGPWENILLIRCGATILRSLIEEVFLLHMIVLYMLLLLTVFHLLKLSFYCFPYMSIHQLDYDWALMQFTFN